VSRTISSRRLAKGRADHIGRDLLPLAELIDRRVFAELARRGYEDFRQGHQAVFINIDDDGTTLTELASRAGLSKQAMHELVSDLEARGYVERLPSPSDGRSKIIRTTDKGERSIEAAWSAIARIEAEWTKRLGARRMNDLRRALHELHDHHTGLES